MPNEAPNPFCASYERRYPVVRRLWMSEGSYPYEALKELTRGKQAIDKKAIHDFINSLKVSATVKKELKAITPANYTGV